MHPAPLAPTSWGRRSPLAAPAHPGPTARPLPWLAGVAVVFTVLQLILVLPGMGLAWDETVYVSQVSREAPAAFFSAPRARGISLLVAPVTELTASIGVMRCYLAVLSGCALFAALWAWRRLFAAPVLALAGTLFCGLWITLFYGPQVMPNLWVAFAALFATGCLLRAVLDHSDRAALAGLGGAVCFAGLMRPSDAVWLALPLAVAALCVRGGRGRRAAVLLVLLLGTAAGCAEWVVEAYVRYGGAAARLHRAGEIQGGLGWHPAFTYQLRALAGRALCRPCDVPWRHPATGAWWFAVPVFTAAGVLVAARARRTATALVPTAAGLSLAVPYLLMIDYAAPRFLLPTYALLSLPTALCLLSLVAAVRRELRTIAAAALGVCLAAHFAVQYAVLGGMVARSRVTSDAMAAVAAGLLREGVRQPCIVTGQYAIQIGYRAGCASRQIGGHDKSITPAALAEAGRSQAVAVLVKGRKPPPYAHGWRRVELPQTDRFGIGSAYVSPPATAR